MTVLNHWERFAEKIYGQLTLLVNEPKLESVFLHSDAFLRQQVADRSLREAPLAIFFVQTIELNCCFKQKVQNKDKYKKDLNLKSAVFKVVLAAQRFSLSWQNY